MVEETTTNNFAEPLIRAKILGELEVAFQHREMDESEKIIYERAKSVIKGRQ